MVRENLKNLKEIVTNKEGSKDIIAITNENDADLVKKEIVTHSQDILSSDGNVRVLAHEEKTRRGQWLGLLDAVKSWISSYDSFNRDSVCLGIMLPGKGTRFSPFTQRLYGIKPFMPVPIRSGKNRHWLSAATASLYTWNLIAYHLKRLGFRGIAWKWGDEPQLPANSFDKLCIDLRNADIVRFGSISRITDDLAQNKEWLTSDEEGNLLRWVRRRAKNRLLEKLKIKDSHDPRAMIHLGSPAFSYILLEKALEIFNDLRDSAWIDVDGYLIEALTLSEDEWNKELTQSSEMQDVLQNCPDFFIRCQKLKNEVEKAKGAPFIIKVIDFGENPYWADMGQIMSARKVFLSILENTEEGAIARELACISHKKIDEFGNRILGKCTVPKDGSIKNSVIIDSRIYGNCEIDSSVIIGSSLGDVKAGKGSVIFESKVINAKLGEMTFSFRSTADNLVLEDEWVHTSMPKDLHKIEKGMDDWYADSRVNTGNPEIYHMPVFGNIKSYDAQQCIMREREVSPEEIERLIARKIVSPLVRRIKRLGNCRMTFTPIRFGTSGLRGSDESLTDMEVYINTRGFIEYLFSIGKGNGGISKGDTISVAADLRPSSRLKKIPRTVVAAILSSGCKVDWCGTIPTPALIHYGIQKGQASIMITGSHIPSGMNGIKFSKTDGELLKEDEEKVLNHINHIRVHTYSLCEEDSLFDKTGTFKSDEKTRKIVIAAYEALQNVNHEAENMYIGRYREIFDDDTLKGMKIVFYQHTAVGRNILPEILKSLGAEVYCKGKMDEEQEFLPLDTEKMGLSMRSRFRILAKEHEEKYGSLPHAIVSTDGDSDRPVLCDENGEFIAGDKLGVLVSLFLKPNFLAIPITCNSSAIKLLREICNIKQTRVGSPYIIRAILDKMEKDNSAKAAGYEANGGYLTGSDWLINGRVLRALPTRDAALPIICTLALSRYRGGLVSSLFTLFNRHTSSDTIDNLSPGCSDYTIEMGKEIINSLSPLERDILEVDFITWRVLYKNGTDEWNQLEGRLRESLVSVKLRILDYFTALPGFRDISNINYLDGIRIYFTNGDIVHLRPSGNAPEFRIYAESSTQRRADEIVSLRGSIISKLIADCRNDNKRNKVSVIV